MCPYCRIKVIEILYYYLLPEAPTTQRSASSASSSGSSTAVEDLSAGSTLHTVLAQAVDFIPQTPMKAQRHYRGVGRDSGTSPTRKSSILTPRQIRTRHDSDNDGLDEDDNTPKVTGRKTYQQLNGTPLGIRRAPSSAKSNRIASEPGRLESRKGNRSVEDKRELLRRVMPNVDALEDRFAAMNLGEMH